MSAFIVNHDHIDLLVAAILTWDVRAYYDPSDGGPRREIVANECDSHPTTLGRLLLRENWRSVAHRYGHGRDNLDDDPLTLEEISSDLTYRYRAIPPGAVVPIHVLKASQCYAYQACEHPAWENSHAATLVNALQDRATARLPGYDEAPWQWTRTKSEQATR